MGIHRGDNTGSVEGKVVAIPGTRYLTRLYVSAAQMRLWDPLWITSSHFGNTPTQAACCHVMSPSRSSPDIPRPRSRAPAAVECEAPRSFAAFYCHTISVMLFIIFLVYVCRLLWTKLCWKQCFNRVAYKQGTLRTCRSCFLLFVVSYVTVTLNLMLCLNNSGGTFACRQENCQLGRDKNRCTTGSELNHNSNRTVDEEW